MTITITSRLEELPKSFASEDIDDYGGKWPVWIRLIVIIGLSALLWAGIIYSLMAGLAT
jgi:hypothetical protein